MFKAFALKDDWGEMIYSLPSDKAGMLIKAIYDLDNEPYFKDEEPVLYAIFVMMKDYIIKNSPRISADILDKRKARTCYEYRLFRNDVLKRDHYQCVKCGEKINLNVHHIKAFAKYPELRFDADNGITLCKRCHRKVHQK